MVKSQEVQASAGAACQAIVEHQAAWARRNGLELDGSGWIVPEHSGRNLVVPIADPDRRAFGDGAGNELDTKMRAPHSSSALAYNCFAAARTSPECIQSFCSLVAPSSASLPEPPEVSFERKRPTGWRGIPPHLDVEVARGSDLIAVESKMAETYGAKPKPGVSLAPYLRFDERSPNWEGMASIRRAAECLAAGEKSMEILDAAQLIKHAIGLRRAQLRGEVSSVTLVLLWFDARELTDAARPSCDQLLAEVDWLRTSIASDITLTAATHQDLLRAFRTAAGDADWLSWLEDRYLSPLDAA